MKKPKGWTLKGKKTNVFSQHLCNRIRSRLGLNEKQLPNSLIRNIINYTNSKLIDFILDNPEGLQLTVGSQPHGYLAVSKHLPKEMRPDKYDTFEKIENLDIPEWRKKQYLKRYETNVKRRLNYQSLSEIEKTYHVNPHSFFYCYRIMWFNHRNCKIKKARAYRYEATPAVKNKLEKKIREGRDYLELQFDDFYKRKLKPIQ